MYVSKYWAACW